MQSRKILLFLLIGLGLALTACAAESMMLGSIDWPEIVFGGGGSSLAVMSFSGVAMPQSTGYEDGEENMGGFGVVAYFALWEDIQTFPREPVAPTSLEDTVKLSGPFVMKSNKFFTKILVPPSAQLMDAEGQGEPGGRSFKNKGEFALPGYDGENRGLARRLNNARGIIVIPTDDGYRVCVGTELRPAQISPSGKSGKVAADMKGFTYAYESDSFAPGYTYNGAIPLSGSTVPAVS